MNQKMDARQFLERVEKLDAVIRNKLIERKQWMDIALGITASTEGERVQSSGAHSKMADAVNRCVDMEAEIDAVVDLLVETKRDVVDTIEKLDSAVEYNVLHMKYIQFMTLQDIADRYKKEYGWATTTHGRAMAHVQEILDKRKVCDSV